MSNTKVALFFAVGCLVILGTCLVGCKGGVAGPPTEPVSGVVTLDGKPVAQANVVFVPDGSGQAAAGITDEAGKYTLTTTNPQDGAVVGKYKVMVTKATSADPTAGLDLEGLSPAERDKKAMQAYYQSGAAKNVGSKKVAEVKHELPVKYNNTAASGLTATVVKGKNTFDFALTSGN